MNRTLSLAALPVALVLVVGCGQAAMMEPVAPSHEAARTAPASAPEASIDPTDGASSDDAARALPSKSEGRAPGDFVVFRFSGSFRKAPLTLSERVVARKGDTIVVDFTAEEKGKKQELRVKMNDAPGHRGEVLSVATIENGATKPATIAAFDALMAKTTLAADQNESTLASESVTIEAGSAKLACKKTTYLVKVGKKTATMRTLESDAFAWGDVGGDITASDGKTLYRAELVEMGHDDGKSGAPLAASDLDD